NRYIKKRRGIWINVWNPDSSLYHLETFETIGSRAANSIARIVEIIKKTPFGKVISLAVYKTLGTPSAVFEDFYLAVEGLGSSLIRKVGEYEPYVIIAEKGKANCLIEKLTKRPEGVTGGLDASATFTLGDIAFMSRSYSEVSQKNDKAIFRALTRDSAYPKLSLLHDVSSWETGDEVVVASSDFDWRQYEVKTIVECPDCEPNQIRVDGDFKFSHFGEVTYGVDERAEVGLLSRNIRIDAEMQNECYFDTEEEEYVCKLLKRDTFGGHTKVLNSAWARIEGVQLTHMGQQSVLATYPLHFHLADSVKGQYLRNNVIRDSNSRCITIHGTDYLEVSDNVCLNHLGHGMFLEDSAEQNNTIHRNLIIGTQYGTLLPTDKNANWCKDRSFCDVLSTFWITHPNNYFTENVAAGSDGSGMVFAFSDRPLGPSRKRLERRGLYEENSTRYMKVGKFHRNVMHSNKLGGLWFDNRVSYGQWDMNKFVPENARMSLNLYTPKDPPKPGGKAIETELSGLTLYKNEDRNSWVRCGNIVITNSSFADSITSYIGAHTVDGTYCAVRNSIFIGETENKGRPYTHVFNDKKFSYLPKSKRPVHRFDRAIPRGRPSYMISGVTFYQGPVYIENCFFDRFTNWYYNDSFIDTWGIRPMRPAAALNFHPNNHYPMIPRNAIKNVTFGFCNAVKVAFLNHFSA
ncbi:transmembrane protein 2, partial [Plakobranchus ocellatus]